MWMLEHKEKDYKNDLKGMKRGLYLKFEWRCKKKIRWPIVYLAIYIYIPSI